MNDRGWDLLDRQSMARLVLDRLESQEWWLLAPMGESGNSVISTIEATYYSGEANADFHLLMDNQPPFRAFYLAKKSRMSAQELADLFPGTRAQVDELKESLGSRDLVLVGVEPGPRGMLQASAFLRWFQDTIVSARSSGEDEG